MPADDFGEKTEAPTPRRLQESRDEGKVAKSQDFTAGLTLLGAVILLSVFGHQMLAGMKVLVETMMRGAFTPNPTRAGDVWKLWEVAGTLALRMVAPVAVGVLVTFKPLIPKFSKLSPISGFKNLFSMRGLMRLGMSVTKVGIVSAVATVCIKWDMPKVLALIHLDAAALLAAAAGLVWSLAIKIAAVLLILGLLDLAYQKWQNHQEMKMSKQEVKDEFKRMEGDPMIKQRRAQVARQIAMQRLGHDVPKADVIVTNPTHFAVALQYDGSKMAAPKVVAKGADYLALRIRQIAVMHNIPIVERPPLARGLWRAVEVGQEIPASFYAAVAEILAYVYRLGGGRKSA
jgi:flagellar biosynthetic protein FlhB